MSQTVTFEVVEISTQKVVKRIVTSGGERKLEMILSGLLRNMDTERFFVREKPGAHQ